MGKLTIGHTVSHYRRFATQMRFWLMRAIGTCQQGADLATLTRY